MRLVKYQDRVSILNFKVFLDFFIDEVVVRHEDQVSSSSSIFVGEVGTVLLPLCKLMKLFNVHRLPWHLSFPFFAVFKKDARIKAFLRIPARCI
jgi:hypothetical protein